MRDLIKAWILAVAVLSAWGLSSDTLLAEVVFDNTHDVANASFGPGCCPTGVEVNLGGMDRVVTSVGWVLSGQRSGVDSADMDLGLYANDGPDGSPGSLLWSHHVTGLQAPPGLNLFTFPVPNVLVPDRITVTSHILSAEPIALGRGIQGTATIGQPIELWLFEGNDPPERWTNNTSRYTIQIIAIPEPVTLVTLASLSLLLPTPRYRRTRRCVG